METEGLLPGDIAVLVFYFAFILATGLLSLWRSNRSSAEGYFLAGGSMLWLPVGASLFASNIGSEHFVGLAGSGAYSGLAIASFELNALLMLQVLGWVSLPVYLASGVYTMPEYLQKRFGGLRIRMYLAALSLAIYIFTKISVDIYSGALFIKQALGWSLYPAIFGLLALTVLYTLTGGLAAVIYTETLQTAVMLVGAMWLCIACFIKIGGYENLKELYFNAIPNETLYRNDSCGMPRDDAFHLLRDPATSDLPWTGILFGQIIVAYWYWTSDQVIVQRALAVKNLSNGQGATLFAGLCKVTPMFFIVLPGMVARVFYTDIVACVDNCKELCGSTSSCSNLAFPLLVMDRDILPQGAHGLLTAVMLSALMSSITSVFNSSSTIFTMDIWRHLRKFPNEREMNRMKHSVANRYEMELMIIGRVFIILLMVVSVLWIPIIYNNQSGQLFVYIQQMTAYLCPPISAVFVLALAFDRVNEQGAFWGLMAGLVLSIIRLVLSLVYVEPLCGQEDTRPRAVVLLLINYMYFALFLFLWTLTWVVVISLMTEPIPKECLFRLTFWTRFSREERLDIDTWRKGRNEQGNKDGAQYAEPTPSEEDPSKVSSFDGITDDDSVKDPSDRSREGTPLVAEASPPAWRRFFAWFCGCRLPGRPGEEETEEHGRLRDSQQMDKIIQTTRDKIILNCGLVVILGVLVTLFAVFG